MKLETACGRLVFVLGFNLEKTGFNKISFDAKIANIYFSCGSHVKHTAHVLKIQIQFYETSMHVFL